MSTPASSPATTAIADRRRAIVTGAASGLGRAIAVRLARDGWHVALADVDLTGAGQTLEHVRAAGGDGQVERLDVACSEQWQRLRERLQATWPRLDLLVNNAGVAGSGEVGQFTLEDWRWLLEINLFGGIYGCHTMVDWLKQNPGRAHVVNTASMAALVSAPAMAAYNISKAGLVSLSETLYAELRHHGVGVTVLCPGFFQTNLLSQARMGDPAHCRLTANSMRESRFTAEELADATLRAIARRQLYVVVPRRGRVWWRLKRWMPRSFMRIVAWRFAKGVPERL